MSPSIVIEVAVKSTAIMAIAAVLAGLMRTRASAASRHLVWTFAVVSLLVLPLAIVVLPSWNIPIHRATAVPADANVPTVAPIESGASPAVGISELHEDPQTSAVARLSRFSWVAILPIVYLAGMALLLGRLGVEYWRTRRILSRSTTVTDVDWTSLLNETVARLGVRGAVRLVRSSEEVMPMTSGTRRPAIVIPSIADTWDDNRRRAVILHELAHIVRFDCFTQTLAAVAAALYWPHPGVWWAARRLRVERELACDDCVLTSGTEPREYASHLLEIAHSVGRYRAPALAIGMARPRQLEGRMMAMLDPTRNRTRPAAGRRVLVLALSVVVVAPLAAATLVQAPVAPNVQRGSSTTAAHAASPIAEVAAAQTPSRRSESVLSGGTWQIRLAEDRASAHLSVSVASNSTYGTTIALDSIEGLRAILTGPGGPAHYTLKRDAGSFDFEGVIRAGAGGGTFTYTPNAAFADELVRRGFSRPTAFDLGTLAWSDIGFAFLDELNALKYERPTLQQLVNAGGHGVSRRYLREMADLGYRVGTLDALVRLRDHGIDGSFVGGMQAEGFSALSVDDLVRARDHGIDPVYVRDLRAMGYALTLNQLVDARNHGVDAGYARGMRAAGFSKLSLEDLINARNHGVDPGFTQDLQELGFKGLSLDDLVNLRNHGVDPNYVREFRQLGYQLTIEELIDARGHGVDPGFVREMAAAGYPHPSIADLVRLRTHGVNAKTVEQLKNRGFDHPSIDRLIELHDRRASAQDLMSEPRLKASKSLLASLHVVLRDANAAMQRWADRWLY